MRRDIFTQPDIALAIVANLAVPAGARVVDLGCGEGVFLEAVARLYASGSPEANPISLLGVETEPERAAAARQRLSDCTNSAEWEVIAGDALALSQEAGFDVVVGNPPWVRLHDMAPALRDQLRARFTVAKGAFDLSHVFVEQGVRLLKSGGALAMILPRAIRTQPAARSLRQLLSDSGSWETFDLPASAFSPRAGIDPCVLFFTKQKCPTVADGPHRTVLSDIADVRSGAATGANDVFVLRNHKEFRTIEDSWLRPVVTGRGLGNSSRSGERILWPYEDSGGRWRLRPLADSGARSYLEEHGETLRSRRRLSAEISRRPSAWYRFIDPGPRPADTCRFVVADIFRTDAPAVARVRREVVLNSCFAITPRPGMELEVERALRSPRFWTRLSERSRRLDPYYRRLSVSELALASVE